MGLWVCNAACKWDFPSISKSQMVCRQPSASKVSEPFCRLVNKRGMQMPTLKTQLSQRNNSSIELCWAMQAPANRLTSPTAWLTEVRADRSQRLQGLWNDNKEKSGMWSQVMGLWVCNAACKWNFPRSQKV